MNHKRRDAGFTIAGLICVMTAVAITSAVMVPYQVMQSKREQEKELIFRGEEYVRAIRKYQRKYQSYPAAIDDLLTRDGFRFLRRQYKDPISGEDFRLITVNSDRTLTGSVTMLSLPVNAQPGAGTPGFAPGNIGGVAGTLPPAGGGQNTGGQGGQANTSSVGGIGGLGGSMGSGGNSGISGSPFASGGGQNNANRPAGVGTGVGTGMGSGVGTGGGAFGGGTFGGGGLGMGGSPVGIGSTAGNSGQQNNANQPGGGVPGSLGGAGGTIGAGAPSAIGTNALTGGGATAQLSPGLAGVGSQSTGTGVMVYNTKEKYNEWEFITPLEQAGPQSGADGANNPAGAGNSRPAANPPGFQTFGGVGGGGGSGVGGGGGGGVGGGGGLGSPFGGGGNQQPAGGTTGGGNPFGGPAGVGTPTGGTRP